jgi:two-component system phosphate regulon sensor histidine kinase PhoR
MIWRRSILWLVAVLLAASAAHAWLSPLIAFGLLMLALCAAVLTQAWFLDRVGDWAALPGQRLLPLGWGVWTRLIERLSRLARQQQHRNAELDSELERIRAAVDRLPDGLIVLDRHDHVLWSNQAAARLHDIFSLRTPIHHFIRQPEFIELLHRRASQVQSIRLHLPSQPGRVHELRLHAAEDEHRLLITRDVTEQAKLDAMRSDFVANVSHEIRTPATVIAGFAETLLNIELDESSRRQYLGAILRQSETMGRLVSDLLTLSALERAADRSDEAEVDLWSMLRALEDEVRALSGKRHQITLDFDGPRRVLAIPAELESAVRNLLTNAVRYTPEGGSITLSWRVRDDEGWISVRDTGIGIAAEHLPRISERFYRVDRSRSRETGGTGLGLAIVKRILHRHHASLKIESEPGRGSTFTIRLPARRLLADEPLGGSGAAAAGLAASGEGSSLTEETTADRPEAHLAGNPAVSPTPHSAPIDDPHRRTAGPAWSGA